MADATSLMAVLGQTELFSGLDDDALESAAAAMRRSSYTAGQMICGRGDPGNEMYLVLEGRVKVSVLNADGRELAFSHISDGDMFGEIAMFDGGERTADAAALGPVKVGILSRGAVDDLMRRYPAFTNNIIRLLCGRIRQTDLQMEGIALHRIEVRLARYLDLLCRQFHPHDASDDTDAPETVTIHLPISQGELALLLGASRPKVNAALALLESDGTLQRKGPEWTCDVEGLRVIGELE
ncbi:MAG: Crp/Fnr family transcriptional regulator [Pseudomonadota bacterium]